MAKHKSTSIVPSEQLPLKMCPRCGRNLLATSEFFRIRKHSGRLNSWCRDCCNANSKQWRENNPERKREIEQGWRDNNPERLAAIRRRNIESRVVTPEQSREWQRKWRKKNPVKSKMIQQRRAAKKRNLPALFFEHDWQRALKHFHNCCAYCGKVSNMIVPDHFIPLSNPDCPGTVPFNIVPACHGRGGCNNSKSDNNPIEWCNKKFGDKSQQILDRIHRYFALILNEIAPDHDVTLPLPKPQQQRLLGDGK